MTSRSYFGKMNSTLGSVVPLAMFILLIANIEKRITMCVALFAIFSVLDLCNFERFLFMIFHIAEAFLLHNQIFIKVNFVAKI